jgi:hypothetical protein
MSTITHYLDDIAGTLQTKGLVKEALTIDAISNTLETMVPQTGVATEYPDTYVSRLIKKHPDLESDFDFIENLATKYFKTQIERDFLERFLAELFAEGLFGFDGASQAISAMTTHPDWDTRWDVSSNMRMLGKKLVSMIPRITVR